MSSSSMSRLILATLGIQEAPAPRVRLIDGGLSFTAGEWALALEGLKHEDELERDATNLGGWIAERIDGRLRGELVRIGLSNRDKERVMIALSQAISRQIVREVPA